MSTRAQASGSSRRLWALSLAVAALALLFLLGLLSLNVAGEGGRAPAQALPAPHSAASLPAASAKAQARSIGLRQIRSEGQGEADLVAGEALFFDPSPLFLPTRWNAGQGRLPEALLQEVEELFEDFTAQLHFARENVGPGLLQAESEAATAARSFALVFPSEESAQLTALGRRAPEPARLPPRSARIEVVAAQGGASASVVVVAELDERAAAPLPAEPWRPLELAVVVDAVGLVGRPQVQQSSGVDAVDEFFREYISRQLHLGARVPPGLYRILVGP